MNLNHAFGFLLVGTVFGLLPRFAPGWCPVNGVDGSSASALWLQVMSAVQISVALLFIGQRVLASLGSMLEYTPAAATAYSRPVSTAVVPSVRNAAPAIGVRVRVRKAIPMGSVLKTGLPRAA